MGTNWGWRQDPQNTFGLGGNSTLLRALKSTGSLASRSFSWYYGLNTNLVQQQKDGQLVFGGYDAAKVTGPKFTRPIQMPVTKCNSGMQVEIEDIELNSPDGTKSSLFQHGSVVACVQPESPMALGLPKSPYFDLFAAYTQTKYTKLSSALHYQAAQYPAGDV